MLIKTEDEALVGDQLFEVEIRAPRWQNLQMNIVGKIDVTPCKIEKLVMPKDAKPISALHLFFKMTVEKTIKLPMFEPEPKCGKTNKDLTYKFKGEVPEWLSLNDRKRQVEIEVDDASLTGTNVPVEVAASIGSVNEKISFAVVFKDESEVV